MAEFQIGMKARRIAGWYAGSEVGHVATIVAFEDNGDWLVFDDGTQGYCFNFEPLPVADATEEAATLKIEEGKYYRNRDGRKVGPAYVEAYCTDGYPVKCDGHWYRADGTSCIDADECDLVAEWQDVPVADEVAAKDPAAATALKFKVGERVRCISNDSGDPTGRCGVVIEVDNFSTPYKVRFDDWTDGHGAGHNEWFLNQDDLELDEEHAATQPAPTNDNQVTSATTTLNFNTDAANAKLDEIIAKLKLIDEMASELGISFTTQQAA